MLFMMEPRGGIKLRYASVSKTCQAFSGRRATDPSRHKDRRVEHSLTVRLDLPEIGDSYRIPEGPGANMLRSVYIAGLATAPLAFICASKLD